MAKTFSKIDILDENTNDRYFLGRSMNNFNVSEVYALLESGSINLTDALSMLHEIKDDKEAAKKAAKPPAVPMACPIELTETERAALAVIIDREIQRLHKIDLDAGFEEVGWRHEAIEALQEMALKLRSARKPDTKAGDVK